MASETRAIRGLVSGRVQGVGFRWFVLQAARRFGVAGDVRNLPDGRVELRAEGRSEALDRLIEAVRRGPAGARVDAVESEELESGPGFDGFEIRF